MVGGSDVRSIGTIPPSPSPGAVSILIKMSAICLRIYIYIRIKQSPVGFEGNPSLLAIHLIFQWYQQWFPMVSKWCEADFATIHSIKQMEHPHNKCVSPVFVLVLKRIYHYWQYVIPFMHVAWMMLGLQLFAKS